MYIANLHLVWLASLADYLSRFYVRQRFCMQNPVPVWYWSCTRKGLVRFCFLQTMSSNKLTVYLRADGDPTKKALVKVNTTYNWDKFKQDMETGLPKRLKGSDSEMKFMWIDKNGDDELVKESILPDIGLKTHIAELKAVEVRISMCHFLHG